MAHPRETLAQTVVALLIAANTAASSRVYKTRFDPQKRGALPALSVYARSDPGNVAMSSEMEVAHDLELKITGWAAQTDAIPADEAINALADQVEIAMRADEYLGGLASSIVHRGTATQIVEGDGRSSPTVGIAVLTYLVRYHIALEAT